jgi:hypothetical protein
MITHISIHRDQCIELNHVSYVKEALTQEGVEEALKTLPHVCDTVTSDNSAATSATNDNNAATSATKVNGNGSSLESNIDSNTVSSALTASSETKQYPRLTFLGTGSSIPSKGRNVSGLLIHLRYLFWSATGAFSRLLAVVVVVRAVVVAGVVVVYLYCLYMYC